MYILQMLVCSTCIGWCCNSDSYMSLCSRGWWSEAAVWRSTKSIQHASHPLTTSWFESLLPLFGRRCLGSLCTSLRYSWGSEPRFVGCTSFPCLYRAMVSDHLQWRNWLWLLIRPILLPRLWIWTTFAWFQTMPMRCMFERSFLRTTSCQFRPFWQVWVQGQWNTFFLGKHKLSLINYLFCSHPRYKDFSLR